MRTLILAAALVAGPLAAAHELDSEQPLTREQIEHVKELAKDLPATTVLMIDQKNPSNMKFAFVKDRLAHDQPLPKGSSSKRWRRTPNSSPVSHLIPAARRKKATICHRLQAGDSFRVADSPEVSSAVPTAVVPDSFAG
jgi:hypothetical protein